MPSAQTPLPRLHAAIPVLWISSSTRAERYYCDLLGFRRISAHRPVGGKSDPCYLVVRRDGASLHLQSFQPERAGGGLAFIHVENLDELCAELSGRGVLWAEPPTDQARTWGNREVHLRDPDGNGLCFAQRSPASRG